MIGDTVKGWAKELGDVIKKNGSGAHAKKRHLAKKISKKMVNRDEDGRRTPDADRNRGD